MSEVPIPTFVKPYVEILGLPLTVEFLLNFGGAAQYLAVNPREHSPVATLIGHEKARALAQRVGPGHVRIPTAKPFIAQYLWSTGSSGAAIARKLHVTEFTVRSYLREEKARQLNLFD